MNKLLLLHHRNLMAQNRGLLPSSYIECRYIENISEAYIDTGVKATDNTNVECDFEGIKLTNSWQGVYGSRGKNYNQALTIRAYPKSGFLFTNYGRYGSPRYGYETEIVFIGRHKVSNNSNIVKIDKNEYIHDKQKFKSPVNLTIFVFNENSALNMFAYMKLYSFKMQENGILVRDFIPAKRKSDNEFGLYDTVERKFYTSPNKIKFTGETI